MNEPQVPARETALLHEYVKEGKLMQIATVDADGAPRLSHCWYAADNALNLVFLSRIGRYHSKEILADNRVAGGIIAIPLEGLGQKVRGVMFRGAAQQVSGEDISIAYSTYSGRWPQVEDPERTLLDALMHERGENRLWRVVPTSYILFDEVNFPDEARRVIVTW